MPEGQVWGQYQIGMGIRIELRYTLDKGQICWARGQDSGLRLELETLSGLTLIEEG